MTPPTPGILEREPAEDRGDASRLLRLLERGVTEPRGVEQELEQRALRAVARDREGEQAEELGAVGVDRRVDERPHVLEVETPAAAAQMALHDSEPSTDRL